MTPGSGLRNAASSRFKLKLAPKTVFLQDNSLFSHHHLKEMP